MNKYEKYYNFIVMDLVKQTKIDYPNREIVFPFPTMSMPANYAIVLLRSKPSNGFALHVTNRYGDKVVELDELWERYKIRMRGIGFSE
jgi:hypothetical protein